MSGSSYAELPYTRCVVGLNAGISISWAPDPDGSYAHGQRHHENEEAKFRRRLEGGRAAIEVALDALEATGRVFTPPAGLTPENTQHGSTGMPIVSVRLACTPRLSEDELNAFVQQVAKAVAEPPPAPPPVVEPRPVDPPPEKKPWWRIW